MTLSIPPGFAEVVIPLNSAFTSHVATVTFGIDTASGAPDASNCNGIFDVWNSTLGTHIDADVLMGPVTCIVGQDGADPTIVVGSDTDFGGQVGNSVPANVAVLMKKQSATGGRRGRGRMFLPWAALVGNVNEGGIIDSGVVSAMSDLGANFLGGLVAAGPYPMVILHGSGISAPGTPSEVTSLVCDPRVATQRRRLGR